MDDTSCVAFLQWALPRIGMRWSGFRKVRRQVCKKIAGRIAELHLAGLPGYKDYLAGHPEEWNKLDSFCHITISRFYRDKSVFRFLQDGVLPVFARAAESDKVRCWSCGCASGEEPYTLSLIWHQIVKPLFPAVDIEIIATDSMDEMLKRALTGRYGISSVKELPGDLLRTGFFLQNRSYTLKEEYRIALRFLKQDVRREMPEGPFDLILCRYLVFTYFDEKLQRELLEKILCRLVDGGALVLGKRDRIPCNTNKLKAWSEKDNIYRKVCLLP